MLTRLMDDVEYGPEGEEIIIRRFGLWGITAEARCRKNVWSVINGDTIKRFKTKAEAEVYMQELFDKR